MCEKEEGGGRFTQQLIYLSLSVLMLPNLQRISGFTISVSYPDSAPFVKQIMSLLIEASSFMLL
jgi:hypothetical protein